MINKEQAEKLAQEIYENAIDQALDVMRSNKITPAEIAAKTDQAKYNWAAALKKRRPLGFTKLVWMAEALNCDIEIRLTERY